MSLEEFFSPVDHNPNNIGSISTPTTSARHLDTFNGSIVPKGLLNAYQAFHPENLLVPVQPQLPELSPTHFSYDHFFPPYSNTAINSTNHTRHHSADNSPLESIHPTFHPSPTFASPTTNAYR
ncbi:hypothetical protein EPUS_09317 [Endocarpon pusillum Z07020]|uniref:Uncharacterized protein n=1 Tax=Endocarpon pusillum (strain Z07020 / HMAS-L-300199) TaxID=1263415 RepID=U1I4V6_ENDPU|nr:uncharacterized protein EPUS_09317 [Endocarpon pusillum Z07020]ERF77144.1 hypothetical protein EPUS_09317 [Endocarpon pusillum Z07020]